MRDPRSLFLLVVALLFITVAFVLISIWGYHFYYLNQGAADVQMEQKKTRAGNSSQNIYDAPASRMGTGRDAFPENDSSAQILDEKIAQYNLLKSEIADMVSNKTLGADVIMLHQKINELQRALEQLRSKTDTLQRENLQLNRLLKEMRKR